MPTRPSHESFVMFDVPLGEPWVVDDCEQLLPLLVGKALSPTFGPYFDSARGSSKGPLGVARAAQLPSGGSGALTVMCQHKMCYTI